MAVKCVDQSARALMKTKDDVRVVRRQAQLDRIDYDKHDTLIMHFIIIDTDKTLRRVIVEVRDPRFSTNRLRTGIIEKWDFTIRLLTCNMGDVAVAYAAVRPRKDMPWLAGLRPLEQINGPVT